MFLSKKELEKYKVLREEIEPYDSKLRSFGREYINFTHAYYLGTPVGKKPLAFYAHGGHLKYIYIKGDILVIDIGEYGYEGTFVELPVDILWDDNWKERVIKLKLEEWEGEIKEELELKRKKKEEEEKREKELYEELKSKYEGSGEPL